jgi:hypothetical protein
MELNLDLLSLCFYFLLSVCYFGAIFMLFSGTGSDSVLDIILCLTIGVCFLWIAWYINQCFHICMR